MYYKPRQESGSIVKESFASYFENEYAMHML